MKYIYIGVITNTHGLKGEIRILSDFEYIKKIMIKDFPLYIGNDYQEVMINSHRVHKNYEMITLKNYHTIEQVEIFKGKKVYINREDLKIDSYFDEDYIGLKVYGNNYLGEVIDILKSKAHDILVIQKDQKKYMVPKIDVFIKKIDLAKGEIIINEIEGLFNEN